LIYVIWRRSIIAIELVVLSGGGEW